MKKKFQMLGTFCDNCGINLTFASHISETQKNGKEQDFCDTHCYEKFLKKNKIKPHLIDSAEFITKPK